MSLQPLTHATGARANHQLVERLTHVEKQFVAHRAEFVEHRDEVREAFTRFFASSHLGTSTSSSARAPGRAGHERGRTHIQEHSAGCDGSAGLLADKVDSLEAKVARASELACDVCDQQLEHQAQAKANLEALRRTVSEVHARADSQLRELQEAIDVLGKRLAATQDNAFAPVVPHLHTALAMVRQEIGRTTRGVGSADGPCSSREAALRGTSSLKGGGEFAGSLRAEDFVAFSDMLLQQLCDILAASQGPRASADLSPGLRRDIDRRTELEQASARLPASPMEPEGRAAHGSMCPSALRGQAQVDPETQLGFTGGCEEASSGEVAISIRQLEQEVRTSQRGEGERERSDIQRPCCSAGDVLKSVQSWQSAFLDEVTDKVAHSMDEARVQLQLIIHGRVDAVQHQLFDELRAWRAETLEENRALFIQEFRDKREATTTQHQPSRAASPEQVDVEQRLENLCLRASAMLGEQEDVKQLGTQLRQWTQSEMSSWSEELLQRLEQQQSVHGNSVLAAFAGCRGELEEYAQLQVKDLAIDIGSQQKALFADTSSQMSTLMSDMIAHVDSEARAAKAAETRAFQASAMCSEAVADVQQRSTDAVPHAHGGLQHLCQEHAEQLLELRDALSSTRWRACETGRGVSKLGDELRDALQEFRAEQQCSVDVCFNRCRDLVTETSLSLASLPTAVEERQQQHSELLSRARLEWQRELSQMKAEEAELLAVGSRSGQEARDALRGVEELRSEIPARARDAVRGARYGLVADLRNDVVQELRQESSSFLLQSERIAQDTAQSAVRSASQSLADELRRCVKEELHSAQFGREGSDHRANASKQQREMRRELLEAAESLQSVSAEICAEQDEIKKELRHEAISSSEAFESHRVFVFEELNALSRVTNLELRCCREELQEAIDRESGRLETYAVGEVTEMRRKSGTDLARVLEEASAEVWGLRADMEALLSGDPARAATDIAGLRQELRADVSRALEEKSDVLKGLSSAQAAHAVELQRVSTAMDSAHELYDELRAELRSLVARFLHGAAEPNESAASAMQVWCSAKDSGLLPPQDVAENPSGTCALPSISAFVQQQGWAQVQMPASTSSPAASAIGSASQGPASVRSASVALIASPTSPQLSMECRAHAPASPSSAGCAPRLQCGIAGSGPTAFSGGGYSRTRGTCIRPSSAPPAGTRRPARGSATGCPGTTMPLCAWQPGFSVNPGISSGRVIAVEPTATGTLQPPSARHFQLTAAPVDSSHQAVATTVFEVLDRNHDGVIDRHEWDMAMTSRTPVSPAASANGSGQGTSSPPRLLQAELPHRQPVEQQPPHPQQVSRTQPWQQQRPQPRESQVELQQPRHAQQPAARSHSEFRAPQRFVQFPGASRGNTTPQSHPRQQSRPL